MSNGLDFDSFFKNYSELLKDSCIDISKQEALKIYVGLVVLKQFEFDSFKLK